MCDLMPADRARKLSRHFVLGDMLIDATFPQLAEQLDPPAQHFANLERLATLLDALVDRFPPAFEIVSGYRDQALNDACIQAGLPASVRSLHLTGCAADVRPKSDDVDLELVYEWLRGRAIELALHEAVFYPRKGFIHVAVFDPDQPTPSRILMRI
ncbi:MAG: DUF882 domain-containing protein [Deltaproteobacteria bacterium]|nr:DUF882 domain-containing protein [Deltaproteobacteria bacterium]